MRKFLPALLLLFGAALSAACGQKEDAAADAAVTLQIAEDSLTKTGARITLYNGSDSEIYFGRSYFRAGLDTGADRPGTGTVL